MLDHGCSYYVLFWGCFRGSYSIFFLSLLTPWCIKCGINVSPCWSGELENERAIVEEEQPGRAGCSVWIVPRCRSSLSLSFSYIEFDQAGTYDSSRSYRLVYLLHYRRPCPTRNNHPVWYLNGTKALLFWFGDWAMRHNFRSLIFLYVHNWNTASFIEEKAI